MDQYLCYYCPAGGGSFQEIIKHVEKEHSTRIVKVRSLELHVESGKMGYRTHNFQVMAKDIHKKNQRLVVKSDEPGNLVISVEGPEEDKSTSMIRSPLAKKIKRVEANDEMNCSNKVTENSENKFEADFRMLSDDDDKESISDVKVFTEQLPSVIETLRKHGQLEIWKKFNDMVCKNEFPMTNIAYLLFLDVVKWFSHDNSVCMRYDDQVTKFWRIGYKLFHGKFLRFMGGPKNKGQVIFGETTRGTYTTTDSRINFAVPVSRVSDLNRSPLAPDNIRPGIIQPLLEKIVPTAIEGKTYKICLDGKKINASTSGKLGDVDLFGFEKQPTLPERKARLENELKLTEQLVSTLDSYDDDMPLTSMLSTGAETITNKLKELITLLGKRVHDLRTTKMTRQASLQKFKLLAGDNWKKSHLCNVISAISSQLYDINNCIERTMRLIDNLCHHCSTVHGCGELFTLNRIVNLHSQNNYKHLNDIVNHEFNEDTYIFLKQRTEKWFAIRAESTVTGSTLNASLGLDTLKSQQEHFDYVKFGKDRPPPSAQVKEKMNYGTVNELHAVATLVAKVLPVLYPNMVYSEVGCVKRENNGVHYIISPDGRCDEKSNDNKETNTMAIEIKCPFPAPPGTYKLPVYYKIPKYYVPQILSEMFALGVGHLLFLCYSRESTAVMQADFDPDLWSLMQKELEAVYTNDHRPVKKSESVVILQNRINSYIDSHVTFLGEFVSVKGVECQGKSSSIDEPFCVNASVDKEDSMLKVSNLKVDLHETSKALNTSYQLNRMKASEFLGFMISDLDRMSSTSGIPAIPIAFGMKGYSLPTETLRRMLEYVLCECARAGLYVPICSFDGQWSRLTVRDQNDYPLTLLQLQKDVYQDVRKMSTGQILTNLTSRNLVRCLTMTELSQVIEIEAESSQKVVVGGKKMDDKIEISPRIVKMIRDWKNGKRRQEDQQKRSRIVQMDDAETDTLASLPVDVVQDLSDDIVQELMNVGYQKDMSVGLPTRSVDDFGISLQTAENLVCNIQGYNDGRADNNACSMPIGSNADDVYIRDTHIKEQVLSTNDFDAMLCALRSGKSKKTWTMSCQTFSELFVNASTINKSFTKEELVTATKPVLGKLNALNEELHIRLSENKHQIVTKLSKALGDGSIQDAPARKTKRSPPSLNSLATSSLRKLPKEILTALYAEDVFPSRRREWYANSPFGEDVNIKGLGVTDDKWYSMPEFNSLTGNYVFMILDSYHQLCGARRLVCQNGIPLKGVRREAFVKVAMESEANGCQLSPAMVIDLIDKQNAAFARATFSEKVSDALDSLGEHTTADFCRMIDSWYKADDEPGISAVDRCKYRLKLKEWLLDGISFSEFPPPRAFIKGIPVVLFEGLLTNVERKIQLYTFSKSGTYNVRSVGSLDIENFFGTFQDLDPKGTGVLRPDDIPAALSVAVELLDVKLDPNRYMFNPL